jgi:hypothetical protein
MDARLIPLCDIRRFCTSCSAFPEIPDRYCAKNRRLRQPSRGKHRAGNSRDIETSDGRIRNDVNFSHALLM